MSIFKTPLLKSLLLLAFIFPQIISSQPFSCQQMKMAVLTPSLYNNVENKRSDTFDILKYTISVELGNYITKTIKGNTAIRFTPRMNNQTSIRFDLLKMTIDSIKEGNTTLLYSYNDTLLRISFASVKNAIDTSTITIYYNGLPQADQSWGGFYFDNTGSADYAYNLGVAFTSKPHNFGRVWFPCFDNFVERSKYLYNITCDTARKAYCNGQLMSDVVNGAKRTRQWKMDDEIPSYLASVAVAKYRQVNWTSNTLTGPKPVILAAAAADTTIMKNGFVNLLNCIAGFENKYGQYRWNRFGYCAVPFNGGAMEHATNISYPKLALGNMAYEASIMAHELSHHWWGDNITCETAEDMWINEGMATYSQYIFDEWQYGKNKYQTDFTVQHENLLHFLHKQEGGFRAVSGIPHNLTYGNTVYKKGADIAHTLRGYMGDTAFFNAVKYTMQQNQKKSINSLELRDYFQASSGQNLVDFFNKWVLAGGWYGFEIDSVRYIQISANNYNAVVYLQQKLYGASAYCTNTPLELSFFKSDWSRITKKVVMPGPTGSFTLTNIPYSPVYCALNYDHKIGDATSFDVRTIKTAGAISWSLGKLYTVVSNPGADSSLIRVVHNWVKADPFKNNPGGNRISNQHYWKIEGIMSPGFVSKARFNYDGTGNFNSFGGLDTNLTVVNGDSVRVFYRKDASDDWKYVKATMIYPYDSKSGFIEIDSIKLGEYAFGNVGDTLVNVKEQFVQKLNAKIFPNPAKTFFKLELEKAPCQTYHMKIFDLNGRAFLEKEISERSFSADISNLAKGNYLVMIEEKGTVLYCEKLLVE